MMPVAPSAGLDPVYQPDTDPWDGDDDEDEE